MSYGGLEALPLVLMSSSGGILDLSLHSYRDFVISSEGKKLVKMAVVQMPGESGESCSSCGCGCIA